MAHPLIMSMKMCPRQWCALSLQPVEDRLTLVHQIDRLTGHLLYERKAYFRVVSQLSPQAPDQAVCTNLSSVICGELIYVLVLQDCNTLHPVCGRIA